MTDPYPSSDFDDWADTYDQDVASDTIPMLEEAGFAVRYYQASSCSGVYQMTRTGD